jgi:hypothetical protein
MGDHLKKYYAEFIRGGYLALSSRNVAAANGTISMGGWT